MSALPAEPYPVINRPHQISIDPYSNSDCCRCGMAAPWRFHQPWWWRLLNPGARWRNV